MYLDASSKIVKRHPNLEAEVSKFDAFLSFRMEAPFEIDSASDHVGVAPGLLARVAGLYVQEEVLVDFDALLCPEHRQVLEEEKDGLFYCDLCDEVGYESSQLLSTRLLRLSNQALEEISISIVRPLEIMRRRKGELVEMLLTLPATNSYLGRTQLLDGIAHEGKLNRDENNQRLDLGLIVVQVIEIAPTEGVKLPIQILIDNALEHCADYEIGDTLRRFRNQLVSEE